MYNNKMLIIGRHTFDILAEVIQSIIDDYDIESKQPSVGTDNGSYLSKLLKCFLHEILAVSRRQIVMMKVNVI